MLGNILTVIEDQQRGYQRTSKSEELVCFSRLDCSLCIVSGRKATAALIGGLTAFCQLLYCASLLLLVIDLQISFFFC